MSGLMQPAARATALANNVPGGGGFAGVAKPQGSGAAVANAAAHGLGVSQIFGGGGIAGGSAGQTQSPAAVARTATAPKTLIEGPKYDPRRIENIDNPVWRDLMVDKLPGLGSA